MAKPRSPRGRASRSPAAPHPSGPRSGLLFAAIVVLVVLPLLIWSWQRGRKNPAPTSGTNQNVAVLSLQATNLNQPNATNPLAALRTMPREPTGDQTANELASEWINLGTALLTAEYYSEAVQAFEVAVHLNPDDEDAFYNMGFALAKLGKREEAKAAYLKALEIFPDYAEVHNNLGNIHAAQGELDKAAEYLEKAILLNTNNASARNNLGNVRARQGRLKEALPQFEAAIQQSPDYVEAHVNLGNTLLLMGRNTDAVRAYNAALRINPGFEPALKGLARAQSGRLGPVLPK